MSPDELLMGALPYIPQTPQNSMNISMGTASTSPGTLGGPSLMEASSPIGAGGMVSGANGTAVLITWFVILFILVACNIFTLRVQS
jgi:hypothetical protein